MADNSRCPACGGDLNDEAAAQRYVLKQKASAVAKAARAKGASLWEIETELGKGGIGEDLIKEIILEVEGKTPRAMAEKNASDMRHGVYWFVGGIVVTVMTYAIAQGEHGGTYIIAWGPVVAGGIQFIRALLKSK